MKVNKLKVMTIVGTRPEIIRLSRVICALDREMDHTLVHTGQNYDYELNKIFFEDLELRPPDVYLDAAGKNAAETIGNVIIKADKALEDRKPEAVLILGDTNSCLAAIPAKRRRIPVFHMEAGNRCFDQRVPEEINRRIVDHVADINMPYSAISREYLLREGFPPDRVIRTGSPMLEVIEYYMSKWESSTALRELGLARDGFFLVSAHREENLDYESNFSGFAEILNGLSREFGLDVVVTTHPRTMARITRASLNLDPRVHLHKPFSFTDYIRLQLDSRAVLSDSGTITEEASILNFPAINLRDAHERPEGMEEASVMMTGMNWERVTQALSILERQGRGDSRTLMPVADYQAPNVSEKVVRIILSHVEYIRRNVWKSA